MQEFHSGASCAVHLQCMKEGGREGGSEREEEERERDREREREGDGKGERDQEQSLSRLTAEMFQTAMRRHLN